jgi:hypothetical protein
VWICLGYIRGRRSQLASGWVCVTSVDAGSTVAGNRFHPPITETFVMASTLDSVVKLNLDRKALRSARVRSVEKELLQLLQSAPRHFQSNTPISAKQLLVRCYPVAGLFVLTAVYRGYTTICPLHLKHLSRDFARHYKTSVKSMQWDLESEPKRMKFGSIGLQKSAWNWHMSQKGMHAQCLEKCDNSYGNDNDVKALKERRISVPEPTPTNPSLMYLLSYQTYKQRESAKQDEIQEAILEPTAMQNLALDRARAQAVEAYGFTPYHHYCPHKTFMQCINAAPRPESHVCEKIHFKPILRPHTDVSLGDCSYLNTCHRMLDSCKYVHYELDALNGGSGDPVESTLMQEWLFKIPQRETGLWVGEPCLNVGELPSQWISCDVRRLDLRILGKFGVLMMDPPWDIHMTLPYGTLTDDEMKDLKIQQLQDDGVLLLWVTGRAMEVGRECLARWGYNRIDELVWVKTNQLQRLIRCLLFFSYCLPAELDVPDTGSITLKNMC